MPVLNCDTISFTGDEVSQKKRKEVMYNLSPSAKDQIERMKKDAVDTGYDEITPFHVLRRELLDLDKYIDDVNSGEKNLDPDSFPPLETLLETDIFEGMIAKKENRDKIQSAIKQNIKLVSDLLNEQKPEKVKGKSPKDIVMSDDLINIIWVNSKQNEKSRAISSGNILESIYYTDDDYIYNLINNTLISSFKDAIYIKDSKDKLYFTPYEQKADNIIKNLNLGSDVIITYDEMKDDPEGFISTIKKKIEKKENKLNFNIVELEKTASSEYLNSVVKKFSKDKKQKTLIVIPLSNIMQNDATKDESSGVSYLFTKDMIDTLLNKPDNIKYLFYSTNTCYNAINPYSDQLLTNMLTFGIPALNTEQMAKVFEENSELVKDVPKKFSKKALRRVVEASMQLDGVFPTKTQKLMQNIAGYYIDKDEITEKEVLDYINEAKVIFNKGSENNSLTVIFNTGKKIKDIIGKTSTKKEASAIVRQIKSKKMGTKGVVIYTQDGITGGGRKFTAKAIAGEAGVPYIEMNAVDFGTKDVSVTGGILSPEASIKTIFDVVKTQAEANPYKSAVLFIEEFENFSIGGYYSVYYQKAMAQLLREMEKADSLGLNILVAGSVSDPRLIGEATQKSFKFIDKLEVASVAFDKTERKRVIESTFKENNIRIENADLIDYTAQITGHFPFIRIKSLVKKAKTVAQERNHKTLNKSDITEAYMQITTGRPSTRKMEEHEKFIVTSHECGHATNLEVMNNIAKTYGKPWHIPDKVNFVTLDPRGLYLGAVYHGDDSNSESSFESVFSDMVCAFGGNSAESIFYEMDGSWGISSDMENVRCYAEEMVKIMGLGAKTGKMTISDEDDLSNEMKRMIEDDERVIINNAKLTSDYITEVYADFNKWFTEKYANLVGTGDCIVSGDDFRNALNEWKSKQSPEKQAEIRQCDETILKVIEATKKGLMVRKYE